jgi:PhnB protein
MANVKSIPEGYHTVTPYMTIKNAAKALDFYKKAFNANELFRMDGPGGVVIMHAEIQIGDSRIMLSDEMPDMNVKSPESYGGSPMSLMLYVDDVDSLFKQAINNGAKEVKAVENQFYGDRSGTLKDPFGHIWTLATHVEDVSEAELKKRMEKFKGDQSAQA